MVEVMLERCLHTASLAAVQVDRFGVSGRGTYFFCLPHSITGFGAIRCPPIEHHRPVPDGDRKFSQPDIVPDDTS